MVDTPRSVDRTVLAMLLATLLVLPPPAALISATLATPAMAATAALQPLVTTPAQPLALADGAILAPLPSSPAPVGWPAGRVPGEIRALADGVLAAQDNTRRPFIVIDKRRAHLYLLGAHGGLTAHTPVLLGAARGDDSVPGIGERPIAAIRPFERTTPAGRFEAAAGRNAQGEDVVWVDYDAAISMHRVRATNPRERRLQRLASPTAADNRVSYGCINVPVAFFDAFIDPLFRGGPHAVYVLPERKPARAVFGAQLRKKPG